MQSYGWVEILRSDSPYHDAGDIVRVWNVKEDSEQVMCPDASGGAVWYSFADIKPYAF
jgi:hypothetical protein